MKRKFLLLVASLLAVGCGTKEPSNDDRKEFYSKDVPEYGISFDVAPYEVNDTKQVTESAYFKMHGRHYYESTLQAEFINFSNSGFEVTFVGTTLEGHFFSTRANETESRPYLAVCIDNDYDPDKAIPKDHTTIIAFSMPICINTYSISILPTTRISKSYELPHKARDFK